MRRETKKERYVIYLSPEVGEMLRKEKALRREATFSGIAERLFKRGLSKRHMSIPA